MKKKPLIPKSIKFDSDKLKKAKESGIIYKLPDLCRKQLDKLLKESQNEKNN